MTFKEKLKSEHPDISAVARAVRVIMAMKKESRANPFSIWQGIAGSVAGADKSPKSKV